MVKRVVPDFPAGKDTFDVIALKDGDRVVGAGPAPDGTELVFVTSQAQLLRFGADLVRPHGRSAGGMAGIKLTAGARVVSFGVVAPDADNVVVTIAGASGAIPGTDAGSIKVTPFAEYPGKGRATGGVRCHR